MNSRNNTAIVLLVMSCLCRQTLQNPANKCVLEEFPTIRTFSSLEEYQNTNISFNSHHFGYQGNVVAFKLKKIEKITKNSFVSFYSDSIVEINLEGNQIQTIDEGSFYGLICLNELNLSHNKLRDILAGVFQGLENLQNLLLSNNFLESTPDSGTAFMHLKNLKLLDLSRNRIRTLHRIAFGTLKNLEDLNLSYNNIRFIEGGVFDHLVNLEYLMLNNNYLTEVAPEKWKDLKKLSFLNLAENYLRAFDAGYNFTFATLRTLNLSGNCLTTLDGKEISQAFEHLAALDVGNNLWLCENLNDFTSSMGGTKILLPPGIKCENVKPIGWAVPTPPPEDHPLAISTLEMIEFVQRNVSMQIHEEIAVRNKAIMHKLEYVQNFLTCVFVVVVMCFLVLLFVKMQACDTVSNPIRCRQSSMYPEQGYNMTEYPESCRLMGR